VAAFPHFVQELIPRPASGAGDRPAFIFILDDTENISGARGVAALIKGLAEHLLRASLPNTMFLVTATPDGIERLSAQCASFTGLFGVLTLNTLSGDSVSELVTRTALEGHPPKCFTDEALNLISELSAGYPGFVQMIASTAYDLCRGPLVDTGTIRKSLVGNRFIKGALASLADRHFRHLIDLQPIYMSILNALDSAEGPVRSGDIRKSLPELKNLGPYLRTLMRRSIVRKVGSPGSPRYKIAAPIVSLWLHLNRVLTRGKCSLTAKCLLR